MSSSFVVEVLFYGLLAFSVPPDQAPSVIVYDASDGAELLPGASFHHHEFKVRILEGSCENCATDEASGLPEVPLNGSLLERSSSGTPVVDPRGRKMGLLPRLPGRLDPTCKTEPEKCGILAIIDLPQNAKPFVCHEVHDLSDSHGPKPERLEYALADLGDKPANLLDMVYKPRGDVVAVRYEIAGTEVSVGGATLSPEIETNRLTVIVSNAPPPRTECEQNGSEQDPPMDIAAHYSVLYDTVYPPKGGFQEFQKREVPVHWGQTASAREMACEETIRSLEERLVERLTQETTCPDEGDRVRIRVVPHDPRACIPPQYKN